MKKFTLLTFLFCILCSAQDMKTIDSLAKNMCKELEILDKRNLNANEKIQISFEKAVLPYLEQSNFEKSNEVYELLFYRIQRGCAVFIELTTEIQGKTSPFKRLDNEPDSELKTDETKRFKELKHFWYLENDGTRTEVHISENEWVSHYADGTYSRYKIDWISDNRFKTTYIESNNARSKMNVVGDEYQYKIVKTKENAFEICEWIEGMNKYSLFDLTILKKLM